MGDMEGSTTTESEEVRPDDASAGRKPAAELSLNEAIQEHAEMMAMLPQYVRDVTKKLETMRMAGIPNRAAYEKFSTDLDQVYQRFNEVSQRVIDFQEETEDSYRLAKERERQYVRDEEAAVHGRKRETDQPPFEERKTPLELYDEEVRTLLADALDLEVFVELYEENGTLAKNMPLIRAGMTGILDKLKNLNAETKDYDESKEWRSLIDVLGKIDERLEESQKAATVSTPLSDSRNAYKTVRAQYAAVQHTLSEDQRRAMRLSIATMKDAVAQAEDEAWQKMFGGSFSRTVQEQFEPVPPPEPPDRSAIRYAVANATEHAPALATAALASMPVAIVTPQVTVRRGLFAALGDAFKLK